MVTFGDMAEALHGLREKYGLYYNPSEQMIFEEAKRIEFSKVLVGGEEYYYVDDDGNIFCREQVEGYPFIVEK